MEEIPVDIKNPSWDHSLPTRNYTRKIIEHAEDAFREQHAKLVGLSVGMALIMLGLSKERTSKNRIGRGEFCIALKKGLSLAKDEKNPVLLFYHDPWTGDVQAITETNIWTLDKYTNFSLILFVLGKRVNPSKVQKDMSFLRHPFHKSVFLREPLISRSRDLSQPFCDSNIMILFSSRVTARSQEVESVLNKCCKEPKPCTSFGRISLNVVVFLEKWDLTS